MTTDTLVHSETEDLLASLTQARTFALKTVAGLTDEQARQKPTASELCLGGLIKHLTFGERQWTGFLIDGASALGDFEGWDSPQIAEFMASFTMAEDETLDELLAAYAATCARTDETIRSADLSTTHALPEAPWLESGRWSIRRAVLHLIGEVYQHAGHADILRESIDGQKTMG